MNSTHLVELEELVLLTIASLTGHAYSIAICDALQKNMGRTVRLSVVYRVLDCLETKRLVTSSMADATSLRGGNRKRHYTLVAADGMRDQLWNKISSGIH